MIFRFRPKKRLSKTTLTWLILILVLIGAGIYLFQTGKIEKAEWLGKLKETAEAPQEAQPEEKVKEPKEEEKKEEEVPEAPEEERAPEEKEIPVIEERETAYIVRAEKGEGITHLARKALKRYLSQEKGEFKLTPEHKIYIEDYIQNRLGKRWLNLGEEMSISKDLIREAINSSQELTEIELENLTQFSALVPALEY